MSSLRRLFEINHGGHGQIRSMEGLRGMAVFMVFIVHYTTLIDPWLAPAGAVRALAGSMRGIGHAGVDLFFVLSGYLIYGTLITKPRAMRAYFRRRVGRIYPAFLAVFAVYLLLSWLFPQWSKIPSGGLFVVLTYLGGNLLLLPGLLPIEPMITVAWSLSYEMFYYLAIPAVIAGFRLRYWSSLARMLAFFGVAVLALGAASIFGASHIRLVMFLAGILLFEAIRFQDFPRIDKLGLVSFVAGLAAIDQLEPGPSRFIVLFISFCALCYGAFRGDGLSNRLFCWTPLRWLGNMSYSYYLIHGLALKIAFAILLRFVLPSAAWGGIGFWGMLPLMFVISLMPAILLFSLVERPFSLNPAITTRHA